MHGSPAHLQASPFAVQGAVQGRADLGQPAGPMAFAIGADGCCLWWSCPVCLASRWPHQGMGGQSLNAFSGCIAPTGLKVPAQAGHVVGFLCSLK